MGYFQALLNYFTEGKGRRDAVDYLKAVVIMAAVMVFCWLLLFVRMTKAV